MNEIPQDIFNIIIKLTIDDNGFCFLYLNKRWNEYTKFIINRLDLNYAINNSIINNKQQNFEVFGNKSICHI